MDPKRRMEILSAGVKTAQEQMKKRPNKITYPRNFMRLYGWLEDALFDLYGAIMRKSHEHIYKASGEVIVIASEIAEYAGTKADCEKLEDGGKASEVSDNKH